MLLERVRNNWWLALVLAVGLLGTINRQGGGYVRPGSLAVVLVVLTVLPLLWRTRHPELVILVVTGAAAVYFIAGYPNGPVYLGVFLSMFALTSRRPVPAWLPYAGTAIALVVLGLVVRDFRSHVNDLTGSIILISWVVTVECAAAAVGTAWRARQESRSEQVRRTATEKQLRMAHDLHDGVGHGLAVIAMQAGVALHVLESDPAGARRSLEAIRDTSKESLDLLRLELLRLSPPTGVTVPRSHRNRLSDLEVLATRVRAGGLAVVLQLDPLEGAEQAQEVGYLVVQEALTNVLRHAEAAEARVLVQQFDHRLELLVTDDGRGSPPSGTVTGLGISGMRSRVEELGGTLKAGPGDPRGFRVHATLPLQDERP